ncbi:protein of unknown function (DU1801) [Octadecabacter temperatus]|uniref:YdhG-like domain-containing protein n=1 Tax=Octadecabacter temperatus TaxID=1458307 RepID=A0A0K0Y406_9RHOB|nr:DUF1801 domain-containing protein [Octadecabacter temperatus]AKS45631.1 hypothetical protein OSB_10740 [Octadecabacter temperatus]SIN97217.1 protein of unknown function (DU1801) [Octadecabacter temperatus]
MDETVKSTIIETVVARAKDLRPSIHIGSKYGGTIFVTDPEFPDSVSLVGGVYGYKDYVSVEFSKGAGFDDPNGLLAGKGKARRHVKLHSLGDIDAMNVAGFLSQAFA